MSWLFDRIALFSSTTEADIYRRPRQEVTASEYQSAFLLRMSIPVADEMSSPFIDRSQHISPEIQAISQRINMKREIFLVKNIILPFYLGFSVKLQLGVLYVV